jgi:hypothetical protein
MYIYIEREREREKEKREGVCNKDYVDADVCVDKMNVLMHTIHTHKTATELVGRKLAAAGTKPYRIALTKPQSR